MGSTLEYLLAIGMTEEYLQYVVLGNTLHAWVNALIIFLFVVFVVRLGISVVLRQLQKIAKRTAIPYDDILIRILGRVSLLSYGVASIYFAILVLSLPVWVSTGVRAAFFFMIVYECIRIIKKVSIFFIRRVWMKENADREHTVAVIGVFLNIGLWTIGTILILSNLGIEVTSLVASLGIGGIAVALAVQNILSDIFSSLSIYIDRPFSVGDFIVVGDQSGTVERIGLKTTRIRALQGEEIVFANSELTTARIQNFKRMKKRRIVFGFGVTYKTTSDVLEKIPGIVQGIIDPIEKAEFDRCHMKEFAESSLNFEVVYYVLTGEYKEYMDIQQEINIGIHRAFVEKNIEMAFPTHTIHMVQ